MSITITIEMSKETNYGSTQCRTVVLSSENEFTDLQGCFSPRELQMVSEIALAMERLKAKEP